MPLLNLRNINLAYGFHPLFDNANLVIDEQEHACIIGRNGAGKSTLLKLILGQLQADSGVIERADKLSVSLLPQDIPSNLSGTAFDCVAAELGESAALLQQYEATSFALSDAKPIDTQAILDKLHQLQAELEQNDGWVLKQRVDSVLSQVNIDPHADMQRLSGGKIRRVLLAAALVKQPSILLLDEPTNHLDIDSIIWLENFLINYRKALLLITHDRHLLNTVAKRIIEVDHGQIIRWQGNYDDYLKHKAQALQAEQKSQREFDKKLAVEEKWIRQGIKARRTRNEGRVRRLKAMREEFKARRTRVGKTNFRQQTVEASGRLMAKIHQLNYAYQQKPIIKDFSSTIMRGDKIGIIGANGCGKSTLLNLILGKLSADAGKVTLGTGLNIAYFDQKREQLDEQQTVVDNIFSGSESITIANKSVHVMTYLQDFLFTPERARVAVSSLSGGERHRLLLARLFTKPCNLLILDEPTNDLDQETLELLEERLVNYTGTLLLVSHDRSFIDNVVTSTWVFEGDGKIAEYVGGYQDYLWQRGEQQQQALKPNKAQIVSRKNPHKKLSYNEQRELNQLPDKIEADEARLNDLQQQLCQPEFYQQSSDAIKSVQQEIEQLQKQLSEAYERWEILSIQQG